MLLSAVTVSLFSLLLEMISWLPGPNKEYSEILTPLGTSHLLPAGGGGGSYIQGGSDFFL